MKKYIGSGFSTKFENSLNLEIDLYQLAEALGLEKNIFARCVAQIYDKGKKEFITPSLENKEFNAKNGEVFKKLVLKISTSPTKADATKIAISLNEYKKPENTVRKEPEQIIQEDDLPF